MLPCSKCSCNCKKHVIFSTGSDCVACRQPRRTGGNEILLSRHTRARAKTRASSNVENIQAAAAFVAIRDSCIMWHACRSTCLMHMVCLHLCLWDAFVKPHLLDDGIRLGDEESVCNFHSQCFQPVWSFTQLCSRPFQIGAVH